MKKILVVDDERPLANALKLKLGKEGFEALAVYNGDEALAELKRGGYDLVLLDLVMPTVDGFTVLSSLKQQEIKIPVIVCSNLGQEEDLKRAKDLGANDYFIKSDTPINTIIRKVKSVLEG